MSHGIHGFGHKGGHGHQFGHFKVDHKGPKGGPNAAQQQQGAQQPGLDGALAALDQAIKSLAASLKTDSYNGAAPPAGVTPAQSGLTNPGNLQEDKFQPVAAGAAAPTAQPVAAPAVQAAPAAPAEDPAFMALKGGGGKAGGVVGSRATFLDQLGSGGKAGGVVGSLL